ncbi:hypothetical protein chiPu_0003196 [Chiloscyllium punctatum]|uniref:Uncharacterized protein n=1 Tax=Chiloscyllium punctatum TaxID=137246 RepID=A0A401S330_CHIPU|nr:hypothetical protein [Chiloscyllium punctatum]
MLTNVAHVYVQAWLGYKLIQGIREHDRLSQIRSTVDCILHYFIALHRDILKPVRNNCAFNRNHRSHRLSHRLFRAYSRNKREGGAFSHLDNKKFMKKIGRVWQRGSFDPF